VFIRRSFEKTNPIYAIWLIRCSFVVALKLRESVKSAAKKCAKISKNAQIFTKCYKKGASIRVHSRALVAELKEQTQFRAPRRLPRPSGPRNDFPSAAPAVNEKTKPIYAKWWIPHHVRNDRAANTFGPI
jgi:hypothetical protein